MAINRARWDSTETPFVDEIDGQNIGSGATIDQGLDRGALDDGMDFNCWDRGIFEIRIRLLNYGGLVNRLFLNLDLLPSIRTIPRDVSMPAAFKTKSFCSVLLPLLF